MIQVGLCLARRPSSVERQVGLYEEITYFVINGTFYELDSHYSFEILSTIDSLLIGLVNSHAEACIRRSTQHIKFGCLQVIHWLFALVLYLGTLSMEKVCVEHRGALQQFQRRCEYQLA